MVLYKIFKIFFDYMLLTKKTSWMHSSNVEKENLKCSFWGIPYTNIANSIIIKWNGRRNLPLFHLPFILCMSPILSYCMHFEFISVTMLENFYLGGMLVLFNHFVKCVSHADFTHYLLWEKNLLLINDRSFIHRKKSAGWKQNSVCLANLKWWRFIFPFKERLNISLVFSS